MPRAGLSAERVVERATQIVDEHGLEALSLSRLAADLGVAPPSLYKHVAGMDDLVRGVSVRAVEELADRLAASVMLRPRAPRALSDDPGPRGDVRWEPEPDTFIRSPTHG